MHVYVENVVSELCYSPHFPCLVYTIGQYWFDTMKYCHALLCNMPKEQFKVNVDSLVLEYGPFLYMSDEALNSRSICNGMFTKG